jgi:hypothetical protein
LRWGSAETGTREVLGLWIETTEGAKFWMKVFNDLRTRGVLDILIAVTDGLTGMPQALEVVFPKTTLQTCIVHLIRNSLDYASWKDRKPLAAALRPIYAAASAEAAEAALDAFEDSEWGRKFPTVVAAWRRAWDQVIPFFTFPPEIRRVIYTTSAIESVNARLRKIIKTRGHFPTDEAASKLIWFALRNITADWGKAAHHWKEAMNQFAILYAERFTREGDDDVSTRTHQDSASPGPEHGTVLSPVKLWVLAMLAPKPGLCVAPVPPQAANLPGPAHDADGMAGRDGGTGALIEPRNMDQPATGLLSGPFIRYGYLPIAGETEDASHTEFLTLPSVEITFDMDFGAETTTGTPQCLTLASPFCAGC